jgi:hypothetical protein
MIYGLDSIIHRPWPGDFSTPEQHVPPTGLDYDWEVCMTMNTSWGFKHYDHNWKSSQTLIRMQVDIASKGGNLLLNVGPTAEGEIPEPSVERLKAMGDWMAVNGESIYGTEASPFFKLPWGRCTSRKTGDGTTLYLHVFNWPENQRLRVPAIQADFADIHNPGYGTHALLKGSGQEARITNWVDPRARLEWIFHTTEKGSFSVIAQLRADNSSKLILNIDEKELEAEIQGTDGQFAKVNLGTMEISEAGDNILTFRPVQDGWKGIELGMVTLLKE